MHLPGTDLERLALQHKGVPFHLELGGREEGGKREKKREEAFQHWWNWKVRESDEVPIEKM